MAMREEVRLDFRADGRDEVKSAAATVKEAATAVGVYEVAERKLALAQGAGIEVILREQSELKALNGYLSAAADTASVAEEKFTRFGRGTKGAVDEAGKRVAEMGRAALNASQSLQDFAQGGVGGVLNNLPRLAEDAAKFVPKVDKLAAAFGGPLGLAAAATGVSVALYSLAPLFLKAIDLATRGSEVFPKTAGGLKAMEAEIKANAKSLEDMEANWRGTSAELEKANKLIERNAELERKAAEARKRESKVESMADKEADGKLDKEGGEIATEAIARAGGAKKVIGQVAEQTTRESAAVDGAQKELARATAEKEAADRDFARANPSDWQHYGRTKKRKDAADKAVADAQGRLAAGRKAAEDRAADLVTSAGAGDVGAIEELAGRLPWTEIAEATPGVRRDQDEMDAAIMADTERTPEQKKKLADKKKREKREKAAAVRKARLAGYEADDASNAESTPEEIRQSELIEAVEARRAKAGGPKLTDKQALGLSTSVMRYEDAGVGRDAAIDAAFDDFGGPAERLRRDADREREKAAREALPGNQLRGMRDQAYQTAAGIAMTESDGSFTPGQLEAIAREAADTTGGLDADSIRQAVYRAAAMTRQKIQADLNRQMGRMWQAGESFLE